MPRMTKTEHDAAIATAMAKGARQAVELASLLNDQGLSLAIALGALHGLALQLEEDAQVAETNALGSPGKGGAA